ncbi:MAG: nicotinamide-nucleotide amidohydrolase family protein [Bacteroidia bacterium]|nr:nicotinamide-nucleotide amidohydrolase family protein [Bacteroidia bacterium]
MTSICLINIGSELLNGRITNTNATRLGEMLQEAGYLLSRTVVIHDDPDTIRKTVETEWEHHDVVLISGGLGPTKDDMTKHVLAAWWGSDLVEHAPTLAFLYKRYAERGREMNDLTKAQAMAPLGAEVLHNPVGTAPGLGFTKEGKWLVAMPGVPFELFTMVEGHVIPRLKQAFPGLLYLKSILRLSNVSESEVAISIEDIEESFPKYMSMAYLPRADGLWLEIKAQAEQEQAAAVTSDLGRFVGAIRERVKDRLYAENDLPLPALLGEALRAASATIAVAESLTGGGLAARIVSVSGASQYFVGSVTAYTEAAKIAMLGVSPALIESKTVVSSEVAIAMAEGVRARFGSTYALSTTGWAEAPNDNTAPGAWVGYAGPQGSHAIWITLYYRRTVNIERIIEQALALIIEKINRGSE